jgi:hypothetical protein
MRVIQPTQHDLDIPAGTFRVTAESIIQLQKTLESLVPEPLDWKFALTFTDGVSYEDEAVDGLSTFPLDNKNLRKSFSIIATADTSPIFSAEFFYKLPTNAIGAYVTAIVTAKGFNYIGEGKVLTSLISNSRSWYNFMFKPSFQILISLASIVAILTLAVTNFKATKTAQSIGPDLTAYHSPVLNVLAAFIFIFCMTFIIGPIYLFDPLVVPFGEEKIHQERLVTARRYLFGSLFTGAILAALAETVRVAIH